MTQEPDAQSRAKHRPPAVTIMRPRRFLFLASVALTTIGLAGVAGVLGTVADAAFFHPPDWINWLHLSLGVVVLAVALKGRRRLQSGVTLVPAVLGTTLGLAGLLFGPSAADRFGMLELADPSDHMAHLTVGLLALWAWSNRNVDAPAPSG